MIDEMQLNLGIHFLPDQLKLLGFTDLGKYTPEEQKKERADHALVCLFKPFRGKFVQNIAAFLSKGAANGEVLSNIVLEAIALLESCGFFVDAVVSDGATWNRNMWKRLGLQGEEASCEHPCNLQEEASSCEKNISSSRRLWMISDFSHLVKNLRNFLFSREEIMVQFFSALIFENLGIGLIFNDNFVLSLDTRWTLKKNHFRAVIDCDGGDKGFGMKIAHKLTPDHIDPKYYQKMHVAKAFDMSVIPI